MKKNWIILLGMIISIIFIQITSISIVSAEVRINEFESNPLGSDSGNEWIELYSENQINLSGWKIMNNDNGSLELNQTINGYLIINLQGQWLDNSDERIFLYNQNSLIDSSILLSDSANDNKTWQYCTGNWNFTIQTKNSQNNCSSPTNPPQNNTQNPNQNNTQNQEASISLDMGWNEDDIVNGDEFEIEVSAENLEDEEYNVKVWIEFEDEDTIISDRYGEDSSGEEVWKSGSYYIYNLLNGPGDETEKVNLRIRENYKDFNGDAKIFFKLSTGEEISKDIEILEKEEDKVAKKKEVIKQNNTQEIKTTAKSTTSVSGNVIKLGSSESKEASINNENTANSNLIYESKNEKIKIYAIIGFAALCLGLAILMVFKKIK